MGRITDIKAQKNTKRLSIFVENRFAFGISKEQWLFNQKSLGDDLSEIEISRLKQDDTISRMWEKIINFLSFRPRSEKETREKIGQIREKIEVTDEEVERLLEKLKQHRYLDDLDFGLWWAEQRIGQNKGPKLIVQELYRKGLSAETIDKIGVEKFGDEDEQIKILLEKNQWRFHVPDPQKRFKKTADFLIRRGYSWETIKPLILAFLDENPIN